MNRYRRRTACAIGMTVCAAACTRDEAVAFVPYEPGSERLGGDTTVFDTSRNAFSFAARNLIGERRDRFFVGNAIFNRAWVTAPASTEGVDGLGPTFNAHACSACHFKDGRGAPPMKSDEPFLGLLLRLSVPGPGGPVDEPTYGGQFNHLAIVGVPAEGRASVSYSEQGAVFADGTAYRLRAPQYVFSDLAFGPMAADVAVSPRVAPVMIGLGLLEAVAAEDIEAFADPEDRDGDGISGVVNRVFDVQTRGLALGRFGWKANQPNVPQQNAGAFLGDMGITSSWFANENCSRAQLACRAAPSGGEPEISDDKRADVDYYTRLLAVPAQRNPTAPAVRQGHALFRALGCDGCHVETLRTAPDAAAPELAAQVIHPFTDLLLHDMGEGLADHRPDGLASGTEWRTPPLWGIGLSPVVNGHSTYLHDGRARNLEEAVLWHGGEAAPAQQAYVALHLAERDALLAFLESL